MSYRVKFHKAIKQPVIAGNGGGVSPITNWGTIKGNIDNQADLKTKFDTINSNIALKANLSALDAEKQRIDDVIVKVNENASQIALIKQIKQEIKDIANSSTDFNDFKGKLGNW